MKILYVLKFPAVGGVEKIVSQLAVGLKNKGHYTSILFLKKSNLNFNWASEIKLHENKGPFWVNFRTHVTLFKQFDVIHNHSFGLIAIYVWFVAIISSKPLVTTIHSSFNLSGKPTQFPLKGQRIFWIYTIFEKLFGFLGKRVIVVAPYLKELISNSLSITSTKIQVIPNSLPENTESVQPIIQRKKNLVFIGRLSPEKRVNLILEAWAKTIPFIVDPEWQLLIYGDGEEKETLHLLTDQLKITDKVKFKGNTNNVLNDIANCQIALSASIYEGLPLTMLEYMQANLCCIVSDIEAHRYLQANRWGVLVDTENTEEFSKAILTVINSAELRARYSKLSSQILKEYSFNDFLAAHKDLYERTVFI